VFTTKLLKDGVGAKDDVMDVAARQEL